MIPSQTALDRLREGNRRFAEDLPSESGLSGAARRSQLIAGQQPFAIILGCSDSRVPAELVFDQGLGDLFVIRVAGNIVAPSQIGSIEYAAEVTGARLVVVMGHSGCGAIEATINELQRPQANRSRNLSSIVDRIRPSVETLLETGLAQDRSALIRFAVRSNIRASVDHLRHGSEILERLIDKDGLTVVGAEYSLETGMVEFFDGLPKMLD
ncbi:MAG: carbonic anhydrase [Verrucomicrobiales bacterium]